MEQQFLLNDLHCAACVRRVEMVIGRLPNVQCVAVNLADQTAFVQGEISPDAVIQAVTKIGFGAELLESEQARREKQQQQMRTALFHKKQQFILALTVGSALMGYGMVWGMSVSESHRSLWLIWAAITAVTLYASGRHFFVGAWSSLKNRSATMDTLIALSTGVAFLYSLYLTLRPQPHAQLYYEASVMIIGFLNLGKFLELKAKQRSSSALEKLLDLAPQQAVVLSQEGAKTIPVKAIKPEMRLQALTGDRLAVDGRLESGVIWVDESMLTGEALPVEKNAGDKVRAGTIVQDGAGVYVAERVGMQTALARIIHAVRHAQSSKPPLAQWVDKIAAVFVPIVVSLALLSAAVWLLLGKEAEFALSVFTTVLIIACPCALGLAVPLSTIAGVARAAEFGVLVRNIDALQACREVDTLVFDKTGTLTTGEMQVSQFEMLDPCDQNQLFSLAKSLEQHASHPIAKAIVKFCDQHTACTVENLQIIKGQGIMADYAQSKIKIGNASFALFANSLSPAAQQKLHASQAVGTQVFIAINDRTLGVFYLQDHLRPEAKQVIQQCKTHGYQCIMLTGDRKRTADYYAAQLGIETVVAEVLPEQKAGYIQDLQHKGRKVAMVGDGINDSPALAQANVGIAMYQGSEIAVETADLSLMQRGLTPLAAILPFSKRVFANMKQSLFGAFIYNLVSMPLAAGVFYPFTGWLLNPMVAAVAMALSSITVVLNSQRLLRK